VSNPSGNLSILAGSWTGVFISTDDGSTWKISNAGLGDTAISSFAVQGTNVYVGTGRKGVFKSTDYGNNWVPANNGMTSANVTQLLITKAGYLFASTNGSGIYINNGNSWTSVDSGLTSQTVYNLISNTDGSKIFAGTFGSGVFLSTNIGLSWSPVNNGLGNMTVEALGMSNDGLYAGTYSCIYKSTDNGSNWTPHGLLNTTDCTILALDNYIFIATAGNGIYLSTDNGTTWSTVNLGLPTNYIFCLAVSQNKSGGHTFFAGTGNGIWKHAIM
jgi:photosystem II stability/assembly factor-like uncharacterized protein